MVPLSKSAKISQRLVDNGIPSMGNLSICGINSQKEDFSGLT